jgi:hypothetical protein
MDEILSYDDLISYCKIMLGEPVIRVNITDDQAMARIRETISLYRQYHYNATEKVLLSHKLSSTEIKNKEIILPQSISGVEEVYTTTLSNIGGWQGINFISLFEKMRNQSAGSGLTSFIEFERNIAETASLLQNKIRWNYTLHRRALKISADWSRFTPGDYIIIEAWKVIDPEENPAVFEDAWVREHAMNGMKYQWGLNLTKFSNVTLPGGISLNGDQIRDEAREELGRMREEIVDKWQLPPMITLG